MQSRSGTRLAASVLLAAATAAAVAACGSSGGTKPSGTKTTGAEPASAGANACQVPATSGSGPWKMVAPKQLCGMAYNSKPSTVAQYKAVVATEQLNFNSDLSGYGAIGKPTGGWAAGWETPNESQLVDVDGWTGTFKPKPAMQAFASGANGTYAFKPASPGPHGGVMECGQATQNAGVGDFECVFATATTIGVVHIQDVKNQLTAPARMATVTQQIRNSVELPAS
jgi:hypothetical protein